MRRAARFQLETGAGTVLEEVAVDRALEEMVSAVPLFFPTATRLRRRDAATARTMGLQIALLRGINVGGHKQVAMAELRDLLTRLGFGDARSLLQSGNLVFRSQAQTSLQLERLLEAEVEKRLGLRTDFFVRAAAQWKTIIANNPFRKEAERDPGRVLVVFLKQAPEAAAVKALQAGITGPEIIRAEGSQAYIVFPDGIGRSRLTHTLIEKKLGVRGTGRNWNTVLKLGALARA